MIKEIPLTTKENETHISDICSTKFYGALIGSDKQRTFITRETYEKGNFSLRDYRSVTLGCGYPVFREATLEAVVAKILNKNFPVLEFSKAADFYNWLAGNDVNSYNEVTLNKILSISESVNLDIYYGIQFKEINVRAFISKEGEKFRIKLPSGLTKGTCVVSFASDSLRGAIEKALKEGYGVFAIDSFAELADWLNYKID